MTSTYIFEYAITIFDCLTMEFCVFSIARFLIRFFSFIVLFLTQFFVLDNLVTVNG